MGLPARECENVFWDGQRPWFRLVLQRELCDRKDFGCAGRKANMGRALQFVSLGSPHPDPLPRERGSVMALGWSSRIAGFVSALGVLARPSEMRCSGSHSLG
jgi:hypothetical protein